MFDSILPLFKGVCVLCNSTLHSEFAIFVPNRFLSMITLDYKNLTMNIEQKNFI